MKQDWIQNPFNSSHFGDLQFYYSGIRERSVDHRYGPRTVSHYLLNFVFEGCADFWCQGTYHLVSPGTFYVMFPGADMYYQTRKDTPWSIQWVVVDGKQADAFLAELGITPENPFFPVEDAPRLKETFDRIFEHTQIDSFRDKMLCFSYLYQMFAQLLEQKERSGRHRIVHQAQEYIRLHLTENLTVPRIASQFYLNSNYFTKLFKANTGVTPLYYINQLRVEKGKYLLEHTAFSVGEIAAEAGIADELYFSRLFKKYTGMSPLNYRKSLNRTVSHKQIPSGEANENA